MVSLCVAVLCLLDEPFMTQRTLFYSPWIRLHWKNQLKILSIDEIGLALVPILMCEKQLCERSAGGLRNNVCNLEIARIQTITALSLH